MEFWMICVGFSMCLGSIPQAYRMYVRKTSSDVSITSWVILVHGLIWWEWYGLMIGSMCLIITNAVGLCIDVTVLCMVIRYRRKV